jgi:ribosomal protein S18 acetylase RimI-like enzyme
MTYAIRNLTMAEVRTAVDWAAAEGWNPGLHDAECFYAADPSGFWGGFKGKDLLATLAAVRYGQGFGFIGLYIVKPGFRGQGLGMAVWNAGMASLKGRKLGLDGVPAQQANYGRSGFVLAHNNIRFAGTADAALAAAPADRAAARDLVPLAGFSEHLVRSYDRPFFPDDRWVFLQHWIRQPGTVALGLLRAGHLGGGDGGLAGGLAGYGVLRPCLSGYKIGPLLADNAEGAERIFRALARQLAPDAALFLDVPATNTAAVALAQRHGMRAAFETARMYTGVAPELPLERLFGITSFELG